MPETQSPMLFSEWIHSAIARLQQDVPDEISSEWGDDSTIRESLQDKYEIISRLGQGGFGVVFRARELQTGREVAIKVLHPEISSLPHYRDRFRREAKLISNVKSDAVVTVYSVDLESTPQYIVMELIAGHSLSDLASLQIPIETAVDCVIQAAEGLADAHEVGLVHRDVKPSNILVDLDGYAKLSDFGLAISVNQLTSFESISRQSPAGTVGYMSPEQVDAPDKVDGRSDIYSLGVVLFKTLTGELPFRGTLHGILDQIKRRGAPFASDLNPAIHRDVSVIIDKCLRKEPTDRYQTVREIIDDLKRWKSGFPIKARPVGALERTWRWCKRNPLSAGLATAVAISVACGVIAYAMISWQWKNANDELAVLLQNASPLGLAALVENPGAIEMNPLSHTYFVKGLTLQKEIHSGDKSKNSPESLAEIREESLMWFKKAMSESPNWALPAYFAGRVALDLRAYEIAYRYAKKANSLAVDDPAMLALLGECQYFAKEYEASVDSLREAKRLTRHETAYQINLSLAESLYELSEFEEALKCSEVAESYSGFSPSARVDSLYTKACTLYRLGRDLDAIAACEVALEIKPEHEPTKRLLNNLRRRTVSDGHHEEKAA